MFLPIAVILVKVVVWKFKDIRTALKAKFNIIRIATTDMHSYKPIFQQ